MFIYSHPSTRGAGRILESNTNPWLSLWFALLLHFLSTPFELRWGYVQKGFLLPHYSTSASKWITPVVHFEINFRSKWSHTSFTSTVHEKSTFFWLAKNKFKFEHKCKVVTSANYKYWAHCQNFVSVLTFCDVFFL